MPEGDNVIVDQPIVDTPILTAEQESQEEFNKQMDYALNGDAPVVLPKMGALVDDKVVVTSAVIAPDIKAILKENFGVDSIEEAKTQWLALQELKANPPKPAEIQFADDQSKKIYELLKEGKTKEVTSFLEQQSRIENLTSIDINKDNADDIIKLGMQLKYKDLTPSEINYKFSKQFQIPKQPIQDVDNETDEAFEVRKSDWQEQVKDIEMNKIIEAKLAKPELELAKSKIQLPEIQPQQVSVDEAYEAFKANNAAVSDAIDNVLIPAIKSLKDTDVPLSFKVEDANNQMNFDVAIAPTKEDFEKARQDSLSFDNFIKSVCYDKDGKFQPQRLQRLILLNNNFDSYAQSIARQAVNAERKMVIEKETSGNNGGGRDFNVNTEKTEFQKAMDFALS